MNEYRVDRAKSANTPCGMNSIIYIGENATKAHKAFNAAQPGFDWWGQPNKAYGVIFSVWHPEKRDYVVKRQKGIS